MSNIAISKEAHFSLSDLEKEYRKRLLRILPDCRPGEAKEIFLVDFKTGEKLRQNGDIVFKLRDVFKSKIVLSDTAIGEMAVSSGPSSEKEQGLEAFENVVDIFG